ALRCYMVALALEPGSAGTHYNIGKRMSHLRRWDEALAAYDEAIRLKPDYAEAYHGRGYVLANRPNKDYDGALAAYEKCNRLKPSPAALNNAGYVLIQQGKLDDAVAVTRKALDLDPLNYKAHYNLGLYFRRQNKLDDARAALEKALECLR